MIFHAAFYIISLICVVLVIYTKQKVQSSSDPAFNRFQSSYLVVYLLAVAGDWLQGPHVYALYESYGMSKHDIEILFIAGFGSSLLVGTFIGSFADKYGRRWNCVLYGILYGLSCITKQYPIMNILMIGRFFGGIATSILYSAFESWLVYEHNKRGYSEQQLSTIFTNAAFGNSIVAIVSGVAAQIVADRYGYVAPFVAALVVLVVMIILVLFAWTENYGDESAAVEESFLQAIQVIRNDKKVLCLGMVQAFFEGSMYTFVLEWTPALTNASDAFTSIPHGYIFATFMVSTIIGSSLFKILIAQLKTENIMRFVLLVSALCFAIPLFFPGSPLLILISFIVFEVCVGMFWPGIASLRGVYFPENCRSTAINIFRIPLNFIVILILLKDLSLATIFSCCVFFLLLAAVAQQLLFVEINKKGGAKTKNGQVISISLDV